MSTDLDLDVLPIYRRGGYDQPAMPGLHLAIPPRRTARGRSSDLLIVLLEVKGNAPLTVNQQAHLLSEISKTYYQHRGSVTASMRAAIEQLNQNLLDRNRNSSSTGLQSIGLMTMIIAKETNIYLAQSGPMHSFVITPEETIHLYNAQNAGRGLGISSTPSIHFFQTDVKNGGLILGSPAPPPTWTTDNLKAGYRLRLENLYKALIDQSGPDLSAMVIKIRPGKGELHMLQPVAGGQGDRNQPESALRPPPVQPPTSDRPPEIETPTATDLTATEPEAPYRPSRTAAELAAMVSASSPLEKPAVSTAAGTAANSAASQTLPLQPVQEPGPRPADSQPTSPGEAAPESGTPAAAVPGEQTAAGSAAGRRRLTNRLAPALLAFSQAAGNLWSRATLAMRRLLGRMTPGGGLFTLPSSVMVSVAIIIPLVVVTIAFTTYLRRGLAGQHEVYLDRASQTAAQAAEITDPLEARTMWEAALQELATAEAYGTSDTSIALHDQAQGFIDGLDGVKRLAYQPALTQPYNENVSIVEMISTPEDIYMLNGTDGTVLRAWLSGRGYEPDATFSCGPGVYGTITVGSLIDIAPLPKGNEFGATVLAFDGNGNLIYCIPGKPPIAAPLVPPDSNWGEPSAIAVDSGNLYILDPMTNAVWMYRGANYTFSDRPTLFFTDEIPPLSTVTDIAANRQDLFLLHTDGHVTTCTGSNIDVAPTRCQDPAPFSDPRPGREPEVVLFPGTQFNKLQFTPPPDPSLYLLDPASQTPYHFSMRLTFQSQYRPEEPLGETPAAAFTVSPNRMVFLAIGNEVYYANIP